MSKLHDEELIAQQLSDRILRLNSQLGEAAHEPVAAAEAVALFEKRLAQQVSHV